MATKLDLSSRQELGLMLTKAAQQLAKRDGLKFVGRVRITYRFDPGSIVMHRASPRMMYIHPDTCDGDIVASIVLALHDREYLAHPEQRPFQHDVSMEPYAVGFNGTPPPKPPEYPPAFDCLICDSEGTHRAIYEGHRFELCPKHASETRNLLGRKVWICRIFKF